MKKSNATMWLICCLLALVFLAAVGCGTQPKETIQDEPISMDSLVFQIEEFKSWADTVDRQTIPATATVASFEVNPDDLLEMAAKYGVEVDTTFSPEYSIPRDLWAYVDCRINLFDDYQIYLVHYIKNPTMERMWFNRYDEEIYIEDYDEFILVAKMVSYIPHSFHNIEANQEVLQFKSKNGALQTIRFEYYSG